MTETTLDVREAPPAERHPNIHDAFSDLGSGEKLILINDHEPNPLFHEMQAEIEEFGADGYDFDQRGPNEFVATVPKK